MTSTINLRVSKGIRYGAEPIVQAELNNKPLVEADLSGYQKAVLMDIDIPINQLKSILGVRIDNIQSDYKHYIIQARKLIDELISNKTINYMCGKALHKKIDEFLKKTKDFDK